MWNKKSILFLFAIIFLVLTACTNEKTTTTDKSTKEAESNVEEIDSKDEPEDKAEENTKKTEEQHEEQVEEEPVEPSTEEIQAIVKNTVNNVHKVMSERANSRDDWLMEDDERKQLLKDEAKKSLQPLSEHIAKESTGKYAAAFLEAMTCHCDAYLLFSERDTRAGFTVTDYTDDTFEAESITVNEMGLYDVGWKSNWTFKKDNGDWKLFDHEFTFPDYDDFDLDVTFEDIEHSFLEFDIEKERYSDEIIPIEFVEYVKRENVTYLVIQMPYEEYEGIGNEPGAYIVYNTELGIEDWEMTEEYNQ